MKEVKIDVSDYTYNDEFNIDVIESYYDVEEEIIEQLELDLDLDEEELDDLHEEIGDLLDNPDEETRDYTVVKFHNQTIGQDDLSASGYHEMTFNDIKGHKVILYSDIISRDELHYCDEAKELFEEELNILRENGYDEFINAAFEYAQNHRLYVTRGNGSWYKLESPTERDFEIEYDKMSNEELYGFWDDYSEEFNFDFEDSFFKKIEEDEWGDLDFGVIVPRGQESTLENAWSFKAQNYFLDKEIEKDTKRAKKLVSIVNSAFEQMDDQRSHVEWIVTEKGDFYDDGSWKTIKVKQSNSDWYENHEFNERSTYYTQVPASVATEAKELQEIRRKYQGNANFDFFETDYKKRVVRVADHMNLKI